MTLICRDDLRYTDDVIATLHSGLSATEIAALLHIPREDVLYHYMETRSMKQPEREPRVCHPNTPNRWPDSPEWYRSRTALEIAMAIGVSRPRAYFYMKAHGLTYRPTMRRVSGTCTPWPRDPEWYKDRTPAEIAEHIGVTVQHVYRHARKHGLPVGFGRKGRPRKR